MRSAGSAGWTAASHRRIVPDQPAGGAGWFFSTAALGNEALIIDLQLGNLVTRVNFHHQQPFANPLTC